MQNKATLRTIASYTCFALLGAVLMQHVHTPAQAKIVREEIKDLPPLTQEEVTVRLLLTGEAVPLVDVRSMLKKALNGEFRFDHALDSLNYEEGTEEYEDALGRLTNIEFYSVRLTTTKEFFDEEE